MAVSHISVKLILRRGTPLGHYGMCGTLGVRSDTYEIEFQVFVEMNSCDCGPYFYKYCFHVWCGTLIFPLVYGHLGN